MNRSLPTKSLSEVALILITRPAKTPAGKLVQAKVLARVESAIESDKFRADMLAAIDEILAS